MMVIIMITDNSHDDENDDHDYGPDYLLPDHDDDRSIDENDHTDGHENDVRHESALTKLCCQSFDDHVRVGNL